MDDKLTAVIGALTRLNKLGSCNIANFRIDEIKIIKDVIKQCDKEWSSIEDPIATRIYLK